ncbi:MAG: hypothetical protein J7524_23310, partial [Roseofilum sp. Belize BBD 4]
ASALYSTLAGLSFTTGAAGAVLATGGSFGDALALYDQFFAGMLDSLTFGGSTVARRLAHGEAATRNHHGLFFNLGRLSGSVASIWIGSYAAPLSGLKTAPWWAKAALGYDLFGTGVGIVQSTINILEQRSTIWDILAFLPIITWLGVNYSFRSQGLGSNGGNIKITPKDAPELPELRFWQDDFSINADVPSAETPRPFVRAELPARDVVEVTDIYRRTLPPGSGSMLLVKTLEHYDAIPYKRLIFTNIENAPTIETYKLGRDAAESVLGRVGRRALEKLGLNPTEFRFEMFRGKLNLIIEVGGTNQ